MAKRKPMNQPELMKTVPSNQYKKIQFALGGSLANLMPLVGAGIGTAVAPGAGTMAGMQLGSAIGNVLPQMAMGGDLNILKGASHENGGIPIDGQGNPTSPLTAKGEAEGNESVYDGYVFSNKITNPKTGNDFFTDSKKFEADENDDDIAKRTKRMMLERLRTAQEEERQRVLGDAVQKFHKKYGGYLPDGNEVAIGKNRFGSATNYGGLPAYQFGGFTNPVELGYSGEPVMSDGYAPSEHIAPLGPQPGTIKDQSLKMAEAPGVMGTDQELGPTTPVGPPDPRPGLKHYAMQMAPFLGAAYNIGTGLSSRDQYNYASNPYIGEVRSNFNRALDYNVDDKLRGITDSRARSLDLIRNMGGSRGGVFNRQLATQDQHDKGRERILSEQSRYQGQVRQNLARQMAVLGERERSQNQFKQIADQQTDAAARNMIGTGLSQVGTNVQRIRNDALKLDLLEGLYGGKGGYDLMNMLLNRIQNGG